MLKLSYVSQKFFFDNYLRTAWQTFQGFANIAVTIVILVVIVSQVTGWGISNYGIKRMLPKLIVMTILSNLSFIICQLAVEVSNIIGDGITDIFINIIDPDSSLGGNAMDIITAILGGVVAGGYLFLSVAGGSIGGMVLMAIVAAIGVLIAVAFFFAILAIRKAAIITLIAIAPLAIICNILPNTQRLWQRWLQAFWSLLVLYPVCGAMIGIGIFANRLFNSFAEDNISNSITSIFLLVGPYFMIPSLTRKSISALGEFGGRLQNLGARTRGAFQRGATSSEGFKSMQQRAIANSTRRRAGIDANGNMRNLNRRQMLMRGGRDAVARNRLQYQRDVAKEGTLNAAFGQDLMLATDTANVMKELTSSGDINSLNNLQRYLQSELQGENYRDASGNEVVVDPGSGANRARIQALTDALSAKGEDGREAVKSAWNSAVTTRAASGGINAVAAQTFANNIMSNHAGEYKNNNRSMFAVAQGINGKGVVSHDASTGTTTDNRITTDQYLSTGDNRASLAGKVTSTTIGNMDDQAFNEIFGGYSANPGDPKTPVSIPSGASASEIGRIAYSALNDQNANIKPERAEALRQIVAQSGYSPDAQEVRVNGGSIDANVTNDVLNVQGNVDANVTNDVLKVRGTVDVNSSDDNPVVVRQAAPKPSGPVIYGPDNKPLHKQ